MRNISLISGNIFKLIIILGFFSLIVTAQAESGSDLYASGDYAGAVKAFEQDLISVSGTGQAPVLNNIGTCYVALGQPDKAIEYYTRAVTSDPSYGRGFVNLGVVWEKLGKTKEAISSYDKVSNTNPSMYAEAMVKKGSLLAGQGDLDNALNTFRLAEPGATGAVVVDLYTGIGAVEFLKKNTGAAEEAFLKAINADPDGAALAFTNLGVLRISQGRYEEAKKLLETASINDKNGQTKAVEYLKKLSTITGKQK